MIMNLREYKAMCAFKERVHGFLKDGYTVLFEYDDIALKFTKLRHRNGNIVAVSFNKADGRLSQTTNGEETFSCTVY